MPAFTMAAACRYALTGVGAAIAAGSQKWKGTRADLESAPRRISTTATGMSWPPGGSATSAARLVVPPATDRITRPTSMASPPAVVTRSACSAAPRLAFLPV